MGPGTSFGELALIYNCSRSCSVKAFGEVILIGLDKNSYLKHFGESVTAKVDVIKNFLKFSTVNLKHHLTPEKLDILSTKLIVKKYSQNFIVQEMGSKLKTFYMLRHGCVALELGIPWKSYLYRIQKDKLGNHNYDKLLEKISKKADEKGFVWVQIKQVSEPGDCFFLDEILCHKEAKYRMKTLFPSSICTCSIYDLKKQVYTGFEKIDQEEIKEFQENTIVDQSNPIQVQEFESKLRLLTVMSHQNMDGGFLRDFKEYDCLDPDPQREFDLYVESILWGIMKKHINDEVCDKLEYQKFEKGNLQRLHTKFAFRRQFNPSSKDRRDSEMFETPKNEQKDEGYSPKNLKDDSSILSCYKISYQNRNKILTENEIEEHSKQILSGYFNKNYEKIDFNSLALENRYKKFEKSQKKCSSSVQKFNKRSKSLSVRERIDYWKKKDINIMKKKEIDRIDEMIQLTQRTRISRESAQKKNELFKLIPDLLSVAQTSKKTKQKNIGSLMQSWKVKTEWSNRKPLDEFGNNLYTMSS